MVVYLVLYIENKQSYVSVADSLVYLHNCICFWKYNTSCFPAKFLIVAKIKKYCRRNIGETLVKNSPALVAQCVKRLLPR